MIFYKFQILIFFSLFFLLNCSFFEKGNLYIENNNFSGQKIYITPLDDKYKQTKDFNKDWTKLYSDKSRPYHRLQNKSYTIIGTYEHSDKIFVVIQDKKGDSYKKKIESNDKINFPSYFLFEKTLTKAENMIGDTVWLNNTYDPQNFYTYSEHPFPRFETVKVIKVFNFQNTNKDFPLWLEVESFSGDIAYVRFNGEEGRIGFPDHYFTRDPMPRIWGKEVLDNILNQKIELGMSERQIRVSIGNPIEVNITSSRHGVGKQLVYNKKNGNKIYYQFEYGKLIYIND